MKYINLVTLFFLIFFSACLNSPDKQTKTDTVVEKKSDSKTKSDDEKNINTEEVSYSSDCIYKSNKGSDVPVTFFTKNGKSFLSIKPDGKPRMVLNQTNTSGQSTDYEKDNFKVTSQQHSLSFSDGKENIELVLISPLEYIYSNNKEDITIAYFGKDDKRYVTIKKVNTPEITLDQTTAWSKGAEYVKDSILWKVQGEEGTLNENGKEIKFKEKYRKHPTEFVLSSKG